MTAAGALVLALVIPAAAALLIPLAHARPNLRETLTLVAGVALAADVLWLLPGVLDGARPELVLLTMLPGLTLALAAEPLGMLFACMAALLWIVNSIYSIGYMRGNREPYQTRFYVCFALALASTTGIAFAANLITFFFFYELLTLSTYPLVTHRGTEEARRAGRLYLGTLIGTSIGLLLLAIVWTYFAAGTTEFRPGGILAGHVGGLEVTVLLALYVFGIGKAAVMPVHRWLPAAMVAPTPVSALLHAVAVVKSGVFAILKIMTYVFGADLLRTVAWTEGLVYVAGATILIASVIALRSDNLKRRLAYSTVSQLSYVVMAAALLAPLSVLGAALHIVVHGVGKITLFFAAGSIYTASHKTEVSQLAGIGRRMPLTMGAFAIASLSMVGIPPTAGFLSKWYILKGAMDSGQAAAVAVIVLSTLLNAGYFLPIVYAAFFEPDVGEATHGEAPASVVLAVVVTALATLALFFFPGVPLELARSFAGGAP